MAQKDKVKWDKKYEQTPTLLEQRDPSKKLVEVLAHVQGNNALDVACGSGKHAIYLAKNSFNVEAMDISSVALKVLDKKGFTNISTKLADLEGFTPAQNSYDLIVKTNYLDRVLIPKLANALRIGGVLFIETYMNHESNEKPNSNPNYLLAKEELKTFFDNHFEILLYEEFDNESYEIYRMKKQAIAVKRSH